jgi:transcriptional regulator with XRE-family HTH domain
MRKLSDSLKESLFAMEHSMSSDQIRPLQKVAERTRQTSGKVLDPINPIELLIRAIEADSESESLDITDKTDAATKLEAWVEQCLEDTLITVPLSTEALAIVSEFTPPASLTEAFLDRVEAKRKAARASRDSIEKTLRECEPNSPGDILRFLRERAGASLEKAAGALGTTRNTLEGIEEHTTPLHAIDPSSMRDFADLVGEPFKQMLTLLGIAAKRLLTQEITSRANVALGRFDKVSDSSTARRERLKIAFARAAEENQRYASFFHKATTQS